MRRYFVLALDGLSRKEFFAFTSYCPSLLDYSQTCTVQPMQADSFLCNSQAAWSTLFTSKSWREHHCTGYATPGNNIDEPKVFELSALNENVLLDTVAPAQTALINLPLVPGGTTVRGEQIKQPPARPQEGRHPESVWMEALEADCKRVGQAAQLLGLQLAVCRLSSFDIAGHLFFNELFDQPRRRAALARLGAAIDSATKEAFAKQSQLLVVSNYSFERCIGVVNINHLLESGGYCVSSLESSSRRIQALKQVAGDPESLRWHVIPEKTTACSPAHGTVFLNTRDRFHKGILDRTRAKAMLSEVPEFLEEACKMRYGLSLQWQTLEDDPLLPDMVYRVPGADYTFCDRHKADNTPAGVHAPEGFVVLPGLAQQVDEPLTAVEAARKITGLIGGRSS